MKNYLIIAALLGACAPSLVPRDALPQNLESDCNVLAQTPCEQGQCEPTAALTAPSLERRRGRVSYYADSFAGRRTASGERYDPNALTAASRDLPFGAIVRVRRRTGGNVVIVRINDRGPSRRGGRLLDVSRAAARCLDMIRAGVVEVDAEVIDFGPRGRRR